MSKKNKPSSDNGGHLSKSHMSRSHEEAVVTNFEFTLQHSREAFRRWAIACNKRIGGGDLGQLDISVLHVVRFWDKPKSLSEIAQALDREEPSSVKYSVIKLRKLDLIEQVPGKIKRESAYQVTGQGLDLTERYATLRKEILISMMDAFPSLLEELTDVTDKLSTLAGMYEQAALRATVHEGVD